MKKIFSLFICLVLLTGMAVTTQAANDRFELSQDWDQSILAGGILDMYAWVGDHPEDYTFQWQADVSMGDGHWMDLEDNADPYGYRGTDTYHLEFISNMGNGQIEGSGWEEIPFSCKVTEKKTGKVQRTANMYMHIYDSENLKDYMAKRGIEIYAPRVNNKAPTTTDDKNYYASVAAGEAMKLTIGFKNPVNDPLMSRSELTAEMEIYVTTDGRTFRLESDTWAPYTVGKDTATVEFKLRYRIGVTELGYYDTKTLKVTTSAPTATSRAMAKTKTTLYQGRSTSKPLTAIPRDAMVDVSGEFGDWYRVCYGGYLGYAPKSAFTVLQEDPIIDHVDIAMAEPGAGNIAPTSLTVKPSSCFATSVEWYDKTSNRYLETGDRFIKGHNYQVVIWVSAKEGHKFKLDENNNMLTTAMINDKHPCFTSRAYEQIIGKVIDIRFDFVNVQEAEAEATTPTQPQTPPTQPSHTHSTSGWRTTGAYHYTVCTTCGDFLDQEDHRGGTATCLRKANCAVCGIPYGEINDHKWSPRYHPVDATGHAWQCADCKGYDTIIPHTPGPAATDTQPQICTVCEYVIMPAKNHTHTYSKVAAKEATCLVAGNQEYYTCDGCSQWWFDAEGTKPVTDHASVILPALGHFTGDLWLYDEENHWQNCAICMCVVEEGMGPHADGNGDGVCDVCDNGAGETQPAETVQPETTTPASVENKDSGTDWLMPVLVAVASFAVAVTVTVLVLKKKK